MTRELEPLIWVALVVSATASAIVYNRMVNRLRPIHPFVRSVEVWSLQFAPNYRLYRLTFGDDRRAMRLWYWVIALNVLTLLLLVLAITAAAA
jgi:hypothetical protein